MNAAWWRDRPVLVTGASGFLGTWLCRALIESGSRVVGLSRSPLPQPAAPPSPLLTLVAGDVRDQNLVERLLREHGIQTIFHLAAQADTGIARHDPAASFAANVGGTWSLLEAARRMSGVAAVVLASSQKVSGAGHAPYATGKACAELIARCYATTYGLPVAVARFCNLYGGGDLNENRLVPGTVRAAMAGVPPVIHSDGTPCHEFLYVEDAVRALLWLAETMACDPTLRGQAVNFGGAAISVLELTRKILHLAGHDDLQPQIWGQAESVADIPQAAPPVDWQPRWTIDEGLRATVEWYRK